MKELLITCHPSSLRACWPEMQRLFPLHWDWLAVKPGPELEPRVDKYFRDEAAGVASLITMRAEGQLIGYWVHYIDREPHYASCLASAMDMWFIEHSWRTGPRMIRLMHAVEAECRRRGVSRWYVGEKLARPCGRLYSACGFRPIEQTWLKEL